MTIDLPSRSIQPITEVTSPEQLMSSLNDEFPTLFDESKIGELNGFEYKITLKPDAKPKVFKLRHPPEAMKGDVKQELDSLLKDGIIQQIDKSEYVHPLHFIRKPDGSIRTTVDFSQGLNKDIVPSHNRLPLPEDIFNRIWDDRFFSEPDISIASCALRAFVAECHSLCQLRRLSMGL